ncbi:MAG: hypothetical protein AAB589_02265 [Patescibacteria group bacterium]
MSLFADQLRALVDATGLFNRKEWAEVLSVDEMDIESWLNDKSIPKDETLRMMLGILRESDGVPEKVLSNFDVFCFCPAAEVSSHSKELGRSVGDYLVEPLFRGFKRRYNQLPPNLKEAVLRRACDYIGQLKADNKT